MRVYWRRFLGACARTRHAPLGAHPIYACNERADALNAIERATVSHCSRSSMGKHGRQFIYITAVDAVNARTALATQLPRALYLRR